jgi:hypothetical protein
VRTFLPDEVLPQGDWKADDEVAVEAAGGEGQAQGLPLSAEDDEDSPLEAQGEGSRGDDEKDSGEDTEDAQCMAGVERAGVKAHSSSSMGRLMSEDTEGGGGREEGAGGSGGVDETVTTDGLDEVRSSSSDTAMEETDAGVDMQGSQPSTPTNRGATTSGSSPLGQQQQGHGTPPGETGSARASTIVCQL